MLRKTKVLLSITLLFAIVLLNSVVVSTHFHLTAADTRPNVPVTTEAIINTDGFERIYDTAHLNFYYDALRDIMMIIDERGPVPYAWTTGANIPLPDDVRRLAAELSPAEIVEQGLFIENRMNAIFINQANSLIQLEFFDDNQTPTVVASSDPNIPTHFAAVANCSGCFVFTMTVPSFDLEVSMGIILSETGISFSIENDDITGAGRNRLGAITIAQYLGALGGERLYFNEESGDFDLVVRPEHRPAYSFVPDGPGALIRFNAHPVALSPFVGTVFGEDLGQAELFYTNEAEQIEQPTVLMPVFGVVHGEGYNGFFANIKQGAEHVRIMHIPNGNQVYYDRIFPRFVFNSRYFQVFNQRGDGFFSLLPEANQFDIEIEYTFLAGDGTNNDFRADWTGMAHLYREFLMIERGLGSSALPKSRSTDIPLRVEFLMAESQRRPFGRSNVVMTTTNDVEDMLHLITDAGIENINVGLLGFANGGVTSSRLNNPRFSRRIGTKRAFQNLIEQNLQRGIDISFADDFMTLNTHRARMDSAVRHISGQFITTNLAVEPNVLVNQTFLARTNQALSWLEQFVERRDFTQSISISGLGNMLSSEYSRNESGVTRTDNLNAVTQSFRILSQQTHLNVHTPNAYLWPYTSRFLMTPIFPFQYIIQTDTVPFLSMVLHGKMELYSPYVNFSFFAERDVLRMIDYNVYPAFLFTKEPSYFLIDTNSSDLFSTEFAQYQDILIDVYGRINDVLSQVRDANWVNRTVLSEGVIINHYDNHRIVVINYTNSVITVQGTQVEPLSARVLEVD